MRDEYRATGNATSFGEICVIGYYKPALGEQTRQYIASPAFPYPEFWLINNAMLVDHEYGSCSM